MLFAVPAAAEQVHSEARMGERGTHAHPAAAQSSRGGTVTPSVQEDERLRKAVAFIGEHNWDNVRNDPAVAWGTRGTLGTHMPAHHW